MEKGPYKETWTRLTQNLRHLADGIIVSNEALADAFGGTIIPHVRDEGTFDSKLYSRYKYRRKYNLSVTDIVVMFFGTPRLHKGVDKLARAIEQIHAKSFRLVVVGESTDSKVTKLLNSILSDRVTFLPNQPFSKIPEIISMADVICLPQDESHETSKYQLPAKAIDAIAMGVPLLVTNTKPMMRLVRDGVAELVTQENLSKKIYEAGMSKDVFAQWSEKVRGQFLSSYSYKSASDKLRKLILTVLNSKNTDISTELQKLLAFQKRTFSINSIKEAELDNNGKDIVLFWKQNDTGLYGRRSDMVIKYLASRKDVRKVIVFDIPVSEYDLEKMRNSREKTQHRQIYIGIYEKCLGKYETRKLSYNVFIHKPGIYRYRDDGSNKPHIFEGYKKYIKEVFDREKVDSRNSIFWIYPKNFMLTKIIKEFEPQKIVADIVDDHRTWPGISQLKIEELTSHYRDVLRLADIAIANCEPVMQDMQKYNSNFKLIPNGCEEDPLIVEPLNSSLYDELKQWQGKVIGYSGNLESKIDINLIEELAKAYPQHLIYLIGSTHANPKVEDLSKYSNVRLPGIVNYKNLGAWLSHFDVAIVPHKHTNLTKTMNPLKIYVYLSLHLPVVSTNVPNVDTAFPEVKICQTSKEFIGEVGKRLSDDYKVDRDKIERYVRENSWENRFAQLVDNLI